MSPITENTVNKDINLALTPFTLALLEDSGWYKANYTLSSPRAYGSGAGCEFLSQPCIVNGEIPDYSKGYFCNKTIPIENGLVLEQEIEYGCNSAHKKKGICDLFDYLEPPASTSGQNPPPEFFQYFPNAVSGLV